MEREARGGEGRGGDGEVMWREKEGSAEGDRRQ